GIVSDVVRSLFELVNYVFLCNLFCVFGIVSNIINIAVFYEQGLKNTMNISFTALTISDLCSLVTLLWFNVCLNPLLLHSDVPMMPSEVQHLTGGWPHACFAMVTAWATVYITAERCLCIIAPLRVKQLVTPRRAKAALGFIYFVMIVSLLPEYTTTYMEWKFYPDTNRTLLGLVFTPDRPSVEGLTFLLYAIYIMVSFIVVILLTALLVINLKQKTKWRKESTFDHKQSDNISNRDKKTIKMVIVIAGVLIVCFTPSVIISVIVFAVPGFTVVGRYANFFFIAWSFGFLFDAINSSVNIVLYYTMSSKYRQTFHQL
ncbi:unnamed protein product, partial [Lymnaea stagnalis]